MNSKSLLFAFVITICISLSSGGSPDFGPNEESFNPLLTPLEIGQNEESFNPLLIQQDITQNYHGSLKDFDLEENEERNEIAVPSHNDVDKNDDGDQKNTPNVQESKAEKEGKEKIKTLHKGVQGAAQGVVAIFAASIKLHSAKGHEARTAAGLQLGKVNYLSIYFIFVFHAMIFI